MQTYTDFATPPLTPTTGEFHVNEDSPPGVVEVTVNNASELDNALDNAVEVVLKAATRHRTGILVTRIGAGNYTVRAHPAVPFGLIRQCHS
jgi:hypothetical protein